MTLKDFIEAKRKELTEQGYRNVGFVRAVNIEIEVYEGGRGEGEFITPRLSDLEHLVKTSSDELALGKYLASRVVFTAIPKGKRSFREIKITAIYEEQPVEIEQWMLNSLAEMPA